ncbi:MAG TPA: tyrosine-type recombinase/integrase [Candidatus Dormibacteraeota bacterium]|jgi:integrase|nr:tyrosine-type recombinase/integrase [Candidatus Dormibacteraeota bacterium]
MARQPRSLAVISGEPATELERAGQAWLAHLRADGRSVKTLYDRDRNIFAILLPHLAQLEVTTLEGVTSKVLDQLAVALSNGGRSPATVATYLRDMKTFLHWLEAEGDIPKTPNVPRVSQPLRHPEVLTDVEYKRLVAAAERSHARDGLMVRVMGESGLRASEVVGLREQDLLELPGGRHQLRVIGKGNKERLVSLPPDLGRDLRRYLKRRPSGSGRIFLSRIKARGEYQPLDRNALTHLVERLGLAAEIDKPVHPHVLRHTFATRAAARGVDPLMLADQLGHTTLTMVRRYIQLSGQQQAGRWDRIWQEW